MKSDVMISVEGLSKAYRIGLKDQKHDTLGAALSSWIKSPVTNFKRVKNLAKIDTTEVHPDIFWALRNINFEVKRGEVLGIIGKNGAGKSTLLKILSRITEPTSGRIEIYGRVASLLEVGTGFNPELTGRENVFLNGTILGMTKREIELKFDEIVSFSGIEKFIDTPVKRYSSGMKVRLAFAVAAHLDPEILIVDEVLAVGDAEFQKKCLGKMHDVSTNEGRTVLFVSHNLAMIQSLCKTGLLLANGQQLISGSISQAVELYKRDIFSVNTERAEVEDLNVRQLSINGQLNDFVLGYNETNEFLISIYSLKSYSCSFYLIIMNEDGVNLIHTRLDNVPIEKGENLFSLKYPPLGIRGGLYNLNIKIVYNDLGMIKRFVSDNYSINIEGSSNLSEMIAVLTPSYEFSIIK